MRDVQVEDERSVARICEPTAPVGPKISAVVIAWKSVRCWMECGKLMVRWKVAICGAADIYVQGHTHHHELGIYHLCFLDIS